MKYQIERLEGYLAGPNVLDWRAFALTEPLFLLFSIIAFVGHTPGGFLQDFVIITVGLLFEVAFAYLMRPVLAPKSKRNSIGRVWLLYWASGELNILFLINAFSIPFSEPGHGLSAWVFLVTNGILKVAWFTIAHVALSLLKSDLRLLRDLTAKSLELKSLRLEANHQLNLELSGLRQTIAEQISDVLIRISKQVMDLSSTTSKADLSERANLVRGLCESEVRSLSHEIAVNTFEPKLSIEAQPKILNPWRSNPIRPSDIVLRWPWVAAIGVLNAVAIALQHGGWLAALACIVAIAIGLVLLESVDRVRLRFIPAITVVGTSALIICEYLLISELMIAGLWFVGLLQPEVMQLVQSVYLVVPIVIVIIWSLVQVIHDFSRRFRLHSDELEAQNLLLKQEVASVKAKSAKARTRLGKLLHGTTQGRLASVSLALTAAAGADSAGQREALIDQARGQLALTEKELHETLRESEQIKILSFDEELASLVSGWHNLVEIDHGVSAEACAILRRRRDLLESVVEAMQECVINAVRHGGAKTVRLKIFVDGGLVLVAQNDGVPVTEIVPGFGIRSISERADDLQIETEGALTKVTVRWPFG